MMEEVMKTIYPGNGASLRLSTETCIGCGRCVEVCPHGVLRTQDKKVVIQDRGACMECGACAKNCPVAALTVEAGVGCAAAILQGMFRKTAPTCGCGDKKDSGGCC